MTDDLSRSVSAPLVLFLFLLIVGLLATDLVTDQREGVSLGHIAVEAAVLLVAVAGCLFVGAHMLRAHRSLATLRSDLRQARSQAEQWKRANEKQLQGISEAISAQFSTWQFSDAEAEVALLLIKGLSHREVASLRGTSERTVRHQATAAYRKAGLSGRTALSAFFLEELLPGGRPSGPDNQRAASWQEKREER